MTVTLELFDRLACRGGKPQGDLTMHWADQDQFDESRSGDQSFQFSLWDTAGFPVLSQIKRRKIIRINTGNPITPVIEMRVKNVQRRANAHQILVQTAPLIHDWDFTGPMRILNSAGEVFYSETTTRTVEGWLTDRFMANAEADGLDYIVINGVESTQSLALTFSQKSRMWLVRQVELLSDSEHVFTRMGETYYEFSMPRRRAGSLSAIAAIAGFNLRDRTLTEDTDPLLTAVIPSGDVPNGGLKPAGIENNSYRIDTPSGSGPFYLPLRDPDNGPSPVQFDNQWQQPRCIRRGRDRTIYKILGSRASDGSIMVASMGTLADGDRVTIVADELGTPLTEVENPAALAEFDRIAEPLNISGGRGEVNLVFNGSMSEWSGAASAAPDDATIHGTNTKVARWPRDHMQVAVSSPLIVQVKTQANGGTSSLALKNVGAGRKMLFLDRLEIAGITTLTGASGSDAKQPDTAGKVALTLASTIGSALADGTELAVSKVVSGSNLVPSLSATVDGAHLGSATTLNLKNLRARAQLITADSLVWSYMRAKTVTLEILSATELGNTPGTATTFTLDVPLGMWGSTSDSNEPITLTTPGGPVVVYLAANGAGPVSNSIKLWHPDAIVLSAVTTTIQGAEIVTATRAVNATVSASILDLGGAAPAYRYVEEWQPTMASGITGAIPLTYPRQYATVAPKQFDDFVTTVSVVRGGSEVLQLAPEITVTSGNTTPKLLRRFVSETNIFQPGTSLSSPGFVAYVNAEATADGAGDVTIVPTAPLAGTALVNANVTVPRPWIASVGVGSANVALVGSSAAGVASESLGFDAMPVNVPAGSSVTVYGHAYVTLWAPPSATVATTSKTLQIILWDVTHNLQVASVTLDPTSIVLDPGTQLDITMRVPFILTASATIEVRLAAQGAGKYGYASAAFVHWAMVTTGPDGNVPFTAGALCNAMVTPAVRKLVDAANAIPQLTLDMVDIAAITQRRVDPGDLIPGRLLTVEPLRLQGRIDSRRYPLRDPSKMTVTIGDPTKSSEQLARAVAGNGSGDSIVISAPAGPSDSTGGGGGTAPPATTLTVRDRVNPPVTGVSTLTVAGIGAGVSPGAPGEAIMRMFTSADPDVAIVLEGGEWVIFDLVGAPSLTAEFVEGKGVLQSAPVQWSRTSLAFPAVTGVYLVYVDPTGQVRMHVLSTPVTLPPADELPLRLVFIDTATYGNRIYAVGNVFTTSRAAPRASLNLTERLANSVVPSGTYADLVRVNDVAGAMVDTYFANLGLLPFVNTHPALVQAHLDRQITLFYAFGGGTSAAFSAANYAAINTTTTYTAVWSDASWINWPYNILDPTGTPVRTRADSHDSYAASFLMLCCAYARSGGTGDAWFTTNYNSIKECMYRNLLLRQRAVNSAAGYMQDTFQDLAMYPFCQTMDAVECYAAIRSTLAIMTSHGGAQATDATAYASYESNLLAGIRSMWKTTGNTAGVTNWLSVRQVVSGDTSEVNELNHWYPDIVVHCMPIIYDVSLNATAATASARKIAAFAHLFRGPQFWRSRRFDLFPWSMVAYACTKLGHRSIGEQHIDHLQRHQAYDSPGYYNVHDWGWTRCIERTLNGETLSF